MMTTPSQKGGSTTKNRTKKTKTKQKLGKKRQSSEDERMWNVKVKEPAPFFRTSQNISLFFKRNTHYKIYY